MLKYNVHIINLVKLNQLDLYVIKGVLAARQSLMIRACHIIIQYLGYYMDYTLGVHPRTPPNPRWVRIRY